MRHLVLILVLLFTLNATAQSSVVDLSNWEQRGDPSFGTWTYNSSTNSVIQSRNGDPTFYVSPDNYINKTVEGEFSINTGSDDDFVGFVLGFESPTSLSYNDYKFVLFDWKKGNQSNSDAKYDGTALAEMRLSYYDFTTPSTLLNKFWATPSVDSNMGNIAVYEPNSSRSGVNSSGGWISNFTYKFKAVYTSTDIIIFVDLGSGYEKIFDVNVASVPFLTEFPNGRFGFYNFSQDQVKYEKFIEPNGNLEIVASGGGVEGIDCNYGSKGKLCRRGACTGRESTFLTTLPVLIPRHQQGI